MSGTLSQSSLRVRELIRDTNIGDPVVDTYMQLNPTLLRVAQEMAFRIGMSRYWISSAFSTVALSPQDYTLSTSVQYSVIHRLRDTFFGRVIEKVSLGEIEILRYGIKVGQLRTGEPMAFAAWEDNTQTINIRLDRVPVRVTAFDAEVSALPVYGATDALVDSTSLPFGDLALAAIERETAAELIEAMSDNDLDKLQISRDLGALFHKNAAEGVAGEKARIRRIVSRPYGVGRVVG